MTKANRVELRLDQIRIDGGTQPRAELNQQVVGEYAETILAGIQLPDGKATFDGSDYWLYGGFHRYFAHKKAGKETMWVEVVEGTLEDARWASLAENQKHGLRRTNGDKRRAVEIALEGWPGKSDHAIAKHCGVSQPFVGIVRRESKPVPRNRDGEETSTHNRYELTDQTITDDEPAPSTDNRYQLEDQTHTDDEPAPSTDNRYQLEDQTHTDEQLSSEAGGLFYDGEGSQVEPEPQQQAERRTGLDGRTRRVQPKPLPQPGQQRFQSKPATPPPPKDDNGTEATPDLEPVFQSVHLFNAALAACHRAVNALQAVESSTAYRVLDDYYRQLYQSSGESKDGWQTYSTSVLCAIRSLKSFRPALVCDACTPVERANRGGSKCKKCSGKGWLSGEDIES